MVADFDVDYSAEYSLLLEWGDLCPTLKVCTLPCKPFSYRNFDRHDVNPCLISWNGVVSYTRVHLVSADYCIEPWQRRGIYNVVGLCWN